MLDCHFEALENRLCLSTTQHHFHTGASAHFVVIVVHRTRHHLHTGVRARNAELTIPPGPFGQASNPDNPSGILVLPGTGVNTGMFGNNPGGVFGGSTAGLFGGGPIVA